MSGNDPTIRIFCPVCSARFIPEDGKAQEGDVVTCLVCGQKLEVTKTDSGWTGERHDKLSDEEIRDRVHEFARIRGYVFNDMKDEIIDGLLIKRDRFGDFYCPCRLEHATEYQCPCKPTRGGDVERLGMCHCGLFRKD